MNPLPNLTAEQLLVYKGLQAIKMGWIALISAISLFTVVLLVFLYAVLVLRDQWAAQATLGLTDATLGFALRTVYLHLFPPLCVDRDGNAKRVA
jgi:uncharacterized membrane protein